MAKLGFIVLVVAVHLVSAAKGNLIDLPIIGDLLPITVGLTSDLQAITIIPGNSIGLIALPLNTLCSTLLVDRYITCFVCNQDCVYVHNSFGGTCATNPRNTTDYTCLCANSQEEATQRGISISSQETCNTIPISLLGSVEDTTFKTVLETRMAVLQCPLYSNGTYQESGCKADCVYNHGDDGGWCAETVPLDEAAGTDPTLHCECRLPSS